MADPIAQLANYPNGPSQRIALEQVVENDTHFSKVTDIYFDTVGSDSYLVRGDLSNATDNEGIRKEIEMAEENITKWLSEQQDANVQEMKTDLAIINANLCQIRLMQENPNYRAAWPADKEGVNFLVKFTNSRKQQGTDSTNILPLVQRLVLKGIICMELPNNDSDIKAYDATLNEIDLPLLTVKDLDDNERKIADETDTQKKQELEQERQKHQDVFSAKYRQDLLRPLSIKTIIHKELQVVRGEYSTASQSSDDKVAIQNITAELNQLAEQFGGTEFKETLTTRFLVALVQLPDEEKRRETFLSIAEGLCVYHKYPNSIKNEKFFKDEHLQKLDPATRTKIYDELVKQLKAVKEQQKESLLDQARVLRALPEFFNILQEIRTEGQTNVDYQNNYLEILQINKKLVIGENENQNSSITPEEQKRRLDEDEELDTALSKINKDIGKREVRKNNIIDLQKMRVTMSAGAIALMNVHGQFDSVIKGLTPQALENNEDYKIETVVKLLTEAGGKQQAIEDLWIKETTNAQKTSSEAGPQMGENDMLRHKSEVAELVVRLEKASQGLQEMKDMKTYFKQQIWVQNCDRVFNFVTKNDLQVDEKFWNCIWEMPESPKTDQQNLFLNKEYLDYLNTEDNQLFNVQINMLLAMAEVLGDKSLMKLELQVQNKIVEKFITFLNDEMQDYRLRSDRSKITQRVNCKLQTELLFIVIYFVARKFFNWQASYDRLRQVSQPGEETEETKAAHKKHTDIMKNFMKDSDMYFKMVFIISEKKESTDEESKKEEMQFPEIIKRHRVSNETKQSDMPALIFFRFLQYYDSNEKVEELLESRKNLVDMLERLQINLAKVAQQRLDRQQDMAIDKEEEDDALKLNDPLTKQGRIVQSKLLNHFCGLIRKQLLKKIVAKRQVKVYRPLFVSTWMLTLQLYIQERTELLTLDKNLTQLKQEDQFESLTTKSKKPMEDLLQFWKSTRNLKSEEEVARLENIHESRLRAKENNDRHKNNKRLLMPFDADVKEFKTVQIKQMISLIDIESSLYAKENQRDEENQFDIAEGTLDDLLKLLFLYTQLTANYDFLKKEQIDDHEKLDTFATKNDKNKKLVQLLPILYKLSEVLLKHNKAYKDYSHVTTNYLNCNQAEKEGQNKEECFVCGQEELENSLLSKKMQQIFEYFQSSEDYVDKKEAWLFPDGQSAIDALNSMVSQAGNSSMGSISQNASISRQSVSRQSQSRQSQSRGSLSKSRTSQSQSAGSIMDAETKEMASQLQQYIIGVLQKFSEIEKRLFLKQVSDHDTETSKTAEDSNEVKQMNLIMYDITATDTPATINEKMEERKKNLPTSLRPFMPPIFEGVKAKKKAISNYKDALKDIWGIKKKEEKGSDDDDDDDDESEDELTYIKNKSPQNEYYDAFVHYSLLKSKIEYRVFETADDLINETLEVVEKLNIFRAHTFYLNDFSAAAEFAYILYETAETLYQWIDEKSTDENWLREFIPKDQTVLEQFMMCTVSYLGQAGFDLQAVQMLSGNINKMINNDAILSSRVLLSRETEKQRIQQMLEKMKAHADKIADYDEVKTSKKHGEASNYCQYIHLQFWGKDFPPELTTNLDGFIMRNKFAIDGDTLTTELQSIFGKDKKLNGGEIKIYPRQGPNENPYGKIKEPHHDQDESLIACILHVMPMTESIYKMYDQSDSSQEQVIDKKLLMMNQEASERSNFTKFFKDNFKQIFYVQNQKPNDAVIENYKRRFRTVIDELGEPYIRSSRSDAVKKAARTRGLKYDRSFTMAGWKKLIEFYCVLVGNDEFLGDIPKQMKKCNEMRLEWFQDRKKSGEPQALQEEDESKPGYKHKIEPNFVWDYMMSLMKGEKLYQDNALNIFVTPRKFPTGFMMQTVIDNGNLTINGAQKHAFTLKEHAESAQQEREKLAQWYDKINFTIQELKAEGVDVAGTDTEHSNQTKEQFERFTNQYRKAKDTVTTWTVADVSGGAENYMKKFLTKGCAHELQQTNDQFIALLQLFTSLERLFEQLQQSLNMFKRCVRLELSEALKKNLLTNEALDNQQMLLDKNIRMLEDIRDSYQMDNLRSQHMDKLEANDEGW